MIPAKVTFKTSEDGEAQEISCFLLGWVAKTVDSETGKTGTFGVAMTSNGRLLEAPLPAITIDIPERPRIQPA